MSKSKQSQSPPEGDASPKRLPEKRLASFVPYRGVLSLRVNGKSVTPLVRDVVPGVVWEDRPVSNAQDTNLYRLREVGLGWKAKGVFAYEALEERVLSLLRHDPNAVFWLEVAVDAQNGGGKHTRTSW